MTYHIYVILVFLCLSIKKDYLSKKYIFQNMLKLDLVQECIIRQDLFSRMI